MMTKKMYNYYLCLIAIFPLILVAQNKDNQTWSNFEIKYNTTNKTSLSFSQSFRLIENSDFVSKYFSDFNIEKRHSRLFSHGVGYRYLSYRNVDDLNFKTGHRFYFDLLFRDKITKRFRADFRTRLQAQKNDGFKEDKIRQKIKLVYNIKKLDLKVFLSLEGFYVFNLILKKFDMHLVLRKN